MVRGGNKRLRAYDPDDPDSFKMRKGRIDSFREELDPETARFMRGMIRDRLHPLYGYCDIDDQELSRS